MSRGILIAGNESSLLTAMCVEAAKRVEKYAVALISRNQTPKSAAVAENQAARDRQIVLEWNPSSPISAKTMVLSGQNTIGHIDDAILVCDPPAFRKNAEEFSAEEIDRFVDGNIKGWFFLVRELTAAFKSRNQGTLSFVLSGEPGTGSKDDEPDLTGPVGAAAFRSFAQGILLSSLSSSYSAIGFSSPEPGEENAFAAYVFKTMDDEKRSSGKWHKYGKFGFLGR